jgi:hypothetical protein
MTNPEILKLAETCGIDTFVGEKDDETDGIYYQFWEEQLLKFADEMRKCGWWGGFEYATEIHTDEINLLREELKKLGKVL